jgi:hypothetical protein
MTRVIQDELARVELVSWLADGPADASLLWMRGAPKGIVRGL